MDGRKLSVLVSMGLALVIGAGCGSMMHRSNVPPAPKSARLGNGGGNVGFGSDPHPSQTGQLQPNGPVAKTGSPYAGGAGLYGQGPHDSELGGAPTAPPLSDAPGSNTGAQGSSMAPPGSF